MGLSQVAHGLNYLRDQGVHRFAVATSADNDVALTSYRKFEFEIVEELVGYNRTEMKVNI